MLAGLMSGKLRRHVRDSAAALAAVFRNADLRRAEGAWAASNVSGWAYGVASGFYAFQQGGATAVGVVAAVRLALTAATTPFLSLLADRFRRKVVLVGSDLVRAAGLGGAALAVHLSAPSVVVYALTVLVMIANSSFRPAHAALVPSLADRPEELTAANVAGSTIESAGVFVGPALGGLLLGLTGVAVVFLAAAGAFLLSAFLVLRIERPEPARAVDGEAEPGGVFRGVADGFETVLRDSRVRLIVGLVSVQTLVSGALNVLIVAMALELLDMGRSGVGYLNAAVGVGGLVGALALLAQTRRLGLTLAIGVLLWGVPIALIGIWPSTVAALLLLGVVGFGNSLVDVPAFTLLQRATPNDVLARVFGVLETAILVMVALGAALAPLLIHVGGLRGALIVTGAFLPIVTVLVWRPLRALDAATQEPRRALELLEGIPLFTPLSAATLEAVAANLVPITVPAGSAVVREGETGDRFYIVDSGRLEATQDARHLRDLVDGDFFGEIALLRDVRRTATVTAASEVRLLALDREEFVAVITGHPDSAAAADAAIATRLGSLRPSIATP
jgi:MFS family permease